MISGLVVAPAGGTTAGAVVKADCYLKRNAGRSNQKRLETKVSRDGSFSFRVPVGTSEAYLDVESPLLDLRDSVRALPGHTNVVLEPELVSFIRGRLLPPLGMTMPTAEYSWTDVEVSCGSGKAELGEAYRSYRSANESASSPLWTEHRGTALGSPIVHDDGTFEISRLPAGSELFVTVKHPFGPETIERLDPLAPGERRELVIALETGIVIAGRVIDENGQPAVGVEVSARPFDDESVLSPRDTQSRADGHFELVEMARVDWRISAGSFYAAQPAEALIDGTAGDVQDLELVVVRGGCIEGTVAWPDGSPVLSFDVSADKDQHTHRTTGGMGAFQVCGLLPGSYRIEAKATGDGFMGAAQVENVQVGARGIRLVLAKTKLFDLRGTIVDGTGAPVAGAWVGRARTYEGMVRTLADGSFVLGGLRAGPVVIWVEANGFQRSEQSAVAGPVSSPLRFVLDRAGRIRGRVLDPRGNPVVGASLGGERWQPVIALFDDAPVSDERGCFELLAKERRVILQASQTGYAPSEQVPLEVAPGATLEGVVLQLRETCRLEGHVLDAHGRRVPGAQVTAKSGKHHGTAQTDPRGAFEIEGLPSGGASIVAYLGSPRRESTSVEVELRPGTTASVEIRFE